MLGQIFFGIKKLSWSPWCFQLARRVLAAACRSRRFQTPSPLCEEPADSRTSCRVVASAWSTPVWTPHPPLRCATAPSAPHPSRDSLVLLPGAGGAAADSVGRAESRRAACHVGTPKATASNPRERYLSLIGSEGLIRGIWKVLRKKSRMVRSVHLLLCMSK